jgi:hypothetical protein
MLNLADECRVLVEVSKDESMPEDFKIEMREDLLEIKEECERIIALYE